MDFDLTFVVDLDLTMYTSRKRKKKMMSRHNVSTVSGIPAKYKPSSAVADEIAVKAAQDSMSKGTIALILLGAVAFVGVGAMAIIKK